MGAKYTTTATSGYNSSAPPDDGSQAAGNQVTWAGIKTKLSDPPKDMGDSVNTKLVAAFDYAVRQITTSDALVAGDHMRTVEIAPTATTGVTVTLADAATMTNIYRVWIKNSSAHQQTIARATGGDTIDAVAASITIPSKAAYCLTTNNAASGYLITSAYPLEVTNLTEETAPANSDLVPIYDLSATQLKKVALNKLPVIIGASTSTATTTGVASINTTAVGNVGAGTDDLMTYALPANSLSANGKGIRFTAFGTTTNNANGKVLGFAFGSGVFSVSLEASVDGRWRVDGFVVRTGSNTQDVFFTWSGATTAYNDSSEECTHVVGTATQTDTASITVKFTGAATSNNDITQEFMLVEFLN